MNPIENPPEKLTETIRGRVESALKYRFAAYQKAVDRSESYVLRLAVAEYLTNHEPKPKKGAK